MFADGVLESRQTVGLHLGPVEGNVDEVFGIHLKARERLISCFDSAEIMFLAMTPLALTGEMMLAENALTCVVTDGEIELGNETACAEAWCFFALGNKLSLESGRCFMRTETRGATERQETLILMLNKTAEPFTDGIARRLVATCSGLDAVLDRVGNQIMAESEFRIRGADHVVV